MFAKFASFKNSVTAAAVAIAVVFSVGVPVASSTTEVGLAAPPSDLKANIGFLTLVQLPCAYSRAFPGSEEGRMILFNPTDKNIDRGRPVTYRLSATGEDFTFHLKTDAGPRQATTVAHRHAEVSRCEAWTYVR